jgi:putative tricarboxylic transport membrane protein
MQRDLAFGGATLALAVGYYAVAATIPHSGLADAIGPAGLPNAYAFLLAGLSLILIARSLGIRDSGLGTRKIGTARRPTLASRIPSPGARAIGMLMIGVVYVWVVTWLGYVLSLAGLIAATSYYQGGPLTRQVAIVAVSGAVFFWLLFVLLLRIPQPAGLWPGLL